MSPASDSYHENEPILLGVPRPRGGGWFRNLEWKKNTSGGKEFQGNNV